MTSNPSQFVGTRQLDDVLTTAEPFDDLRFGLPCSCLMAATLDPRGTPNASWTYGRSRVQSRARDRE